MAVELFIVTFVAGNEVGMVVVAIDEADLTGVEKAEVPPVQLDLYFNVTPVGSAEPRYTLNALTVREVTSIGSLINASYEFSPAVIGTEDTT